MITKDFLGLVINVLWHEASSCRQTVQLFNSSDDMRVDPHSTKGHYCFWSLVGEDGNKIDAVELRLVATDVYNSE